ncbi:MAG: hypothetical protein IJK15_09335 [Bacteroidaceae bacterium]|nr:hypothetical protein [Bacteroidaceae bacterium]
MNRGGSWNNNDNNCRVANRNRNNASNTNNNLGLRLALLAPDISSLVVAIINQEQEE